MIAFDIGAYNGDTTSILLNTFSKVVCVDANPEVVLELRDKYANNDRVGVIEGCICNSKKDVDFYISDFGLWCSTNKDIAERLSRSKKVIKVKPLNIVDIVEQYGCPYYLKCDIEGNDIVLLQQLKESPYRPRYISCESECIGNRDIDISSDEDLVVLNGMKDLGYTKFVLVNQRNNKVNETNLTFNTFDFEDLDDSWLTYEEIRDLLRGISREMYDKYHFWFDIVATT